MKTIKITMLVCVLCLVANFSFSQKMYQVHQDNVNPSMLMEYEKTAKKFNDACVEHNLQSQWLTVMMDDFTFLYVTPIENFSELDKRPMADMAEAMGDEFGKMFEDFDKCYDSHGSYTIMLDESLTYMPDGVDQSTEGQDYRDFYYIYFTPQNEKSLRSAMKEVKEMFAAKGSKNYYRIYRTGFGVMDNYYMVAMSSKDEVDSAQKSKANEELLGPERYETFNKVLSAASAMEEVTGQIRRDLSYSAKKE